MSDWPARRVKVYPRVCGGSVGESLQQFDNVGLSPRVRGKRKVCEVQHRQPGSIPACAGEAYQERVCAQCRRVYPRVCGGSAVRAMTPYDGRGLSPRVRGKRTPVSICCAN